MVRILKNRSLIRQSDLPLFSPTLGAVYASWTVPFEARGFSTFMKSNLYIYAYVTVLFPSHLRKLCLTRGYEDWLLCSSKTSIVFTLKIKSSIHSEFIFAHAGRDPPCFILLLVDIWLAQCHLFAQILLNLHIHHTVDVYYYPYCEGG